MTSTSYGETELGSRVSGVSDSLLGSLGALRRRVRVGTSMQGLGLLVTAFALYYLLTLGVDRFFRLEQAVRAVLLAAWIILTIRALYRVWILPLSRSLADDELALAVERARPGLGQHLISSLQFCRNLELRTYHGSSPRLMAEVVGQLAALLPGIQFSSAVRADKVRKALGLAVACLVVLLGSALYSPPAFEIWASRNLLLSSVEWPRMTKLRVLGAAGTTISVPRGDDFTVEVEAGGVVPDQVRLRYEFPDGSGATEVMVQSTGQAQFSYTFPGLMDPVRFHAFGGDGLTEEYRVQLVDRPALEEISIQLHFPSYMGREPLDVPMEKGELRLPVGAVIAVKGRATKDLVSASLAIGDMQQSPAEVTGRDFAGRIRPAASGLFFMRFEDVDGLTEGAGDRLLLKVVPDKAPRVSIRVRGVGQKITPMARIPADVTVIDDFSIEEIKLYWRVGDSAAIGSEEKLGSGYREGVAQGIEHFNKGTEVFDGRLVLDLQELLKNADQLMDPANPVRPGQFVALRFKAWDNKPEDGKPQVGPGAGETTQSAVSDSYTFKVVTPAELLVELHRRQEELSHQFELLIKREKADRDEFLDLAELSTPGELGRKIRRRVSSLARHQFQMAHTARRIGLSYAGIIDEMINNRLGEELVVRQLRRYIVGQLEELATSLMPSLAKSIKEYRQKGGEGLKGEIQRRYDEILRRMATILAQMRRFQSITEILRQLREVILLEGKAHDRALDAYEKAKKALFEPDKTSGPDKKTKGNDKPGKPGSGRKN
ncbi:MAG: hypothetical protein ACE5F1_02115 [Planctomycetota bacterium]